MKIDSKGNLIVGSVAVLAITLLLISIFIITSINYIENENSQLKSNNEFKYIIDDYERNLEVLERQSIAEATQKVYNGLPIFDSEKQIKKNLDKALNEKNKEFEKKYGVKISSQTVDVENTNSPWKILFKVKLNVQKNNIRYSNIVERNASVEGLKDPLPLAKLTIASGILTYDEKIHYKNAIAGYMVIHNFKSPESYIEATAPMYIIKCPYDPYTHHGDPGVLDDCLKKGYFHESADGSCYLCRLEGKGKCPHYGFEVFIQTHTFLKNESLSCPDHVVFSDHYYAAKINESEPNSLILDNAHRKKYGLI